MVRSGGSGYIRGMDKQIPLSLKASEDGAEGAAPADPVSEPELKDQPVIGYLAVICGQGAWGFAGLVLSVIGLMSSPALLALLGLGAVAAFFGLG